MPATLTLLGLGPGNPEHRTLEAAELLASASRILLRTAIHPGLDDLAHDPRVTSCDDLYEHEASFDRVYDAIVERVIGMLAHGDLVFAVPGHPLIGERTVTMLLDRADTKGFATRIVPGVSAVDVMAGALRVDPMATEAQILDATELERFAHTEPFSGGLPDVSPRRPVLLTQVYSRAVASAAKLQLAKLFPDDWPITIVIAAGVSGEESIIRCRLFELDRYLVDHLTSVWVPAMPALDAAHWPLTLHTIAARLRASNGCPWDRKQTHASLRDSVLEEAYEVADALDEGDPAQLAEELGDQLLLVAMHAQIADEAGEFSIGDVYDHVNRKLVRRHPHVFGDATAATPEAVVQTWDGVKAAERAAKGQAPKPTAADPFDRLPRSMSVLTRITKTLGAPNPPDPEKICDQTADDLLALVERLAKSGVDPEAALERAYRRRVAASPTN